MLELQSGSIFGGRYKVQKAIGSGGMGAVYLATDSRYNEFPVALKILYPGFIKTPEARERFKTEIIASYLITHRNVVRAYEYFDNQSSQAYAMEYVNGSDLQVLLSERSVTVNQAISILRQACAGLAAIHRHGIIHRDLKPENIMVGKNGVVKIADFGVARMRGDNTGVTQIGAMVGTPKYFAPEYIELGDMDQRGDIYALGVIGFELIGGESPFRSNSQVSLMVERVQLPQRSLLSVAPNCPTDLAYIIEKAMRVAVDDRYQTAEEMRADLERVQSGKALRFWTPAQPRPEISAQTAFGNNLAKLENQPTAVPLFKSQVQPLDKAVNPPIAFQTSFWTVAAASFMLVILVGIGGFYYLKVTPLSLLADLNDGSYDGYVYDNLDQARDYRLRMWKEDQQIRIEIDKEQCQNLSIDNEQRFTCHGKEYQLKLDLANSYSAIGRIRVGTEKYWAKWSAIKSGS